jgi:hypothetical protein
MGFIKNFSRVVADAGRIDALESLATTGAVRNYGVSVITADGGVFSLADPVGGLRKSILIENTTAQTTMNINNASTATEFQNSTEDGIVASTASAGTLRYIDLVGLSTAKWGVVSMSTGLSFG